MPIAQFSGLASGIDSAALIDAVVEARQVRNDIRKEQIEDIEEESDALLEFKTKLQTLSDLLDKFRTANGGGLAKRASSIDPSVLTASASPGAVNASYSISVTSVADTATGSFDAAYSDVTDVVSAAGGDVTVTVGTGGDQVVLNQTLTAGVTTVEDLVAAFNADPNANGRVFASAVNVGTDSTPDYRIMFTSLESGEAQGTLALSSTAVELAASTIDQATNAVFTVGGIGTAITRESNTVNDVISGVSFSLVDTGSTTVTVSDDASTTSGEITEVVEAYNDIVTFYNENNLVERIEFGEDNATNVFAPLAKVRIDDDFLSAFRLEMAAADSVSGVEVSSLAEMGFITNRADGSIIFDESDFTEAVAADPTGVSEVLNDFADRLAGVDGMIYEYTKLNGLIDISIESNNAEIENISEAIARLDRQTDKLRDGLTRQFANLEGVTGDLQNQQQALTSILAGLQ